MKSFLHFAAPIVTCLTRNFKNYMPLGGIVFANDLPGIITFLLRPNLINYLKISNGNKGYKIVYTMLQI